MSALPLEHVSIRPDDHREAPPAVVLLHGRGADERDLLPLADALPGDRHVISLRAPTELGSGYTWYDLDLSDGGLHASQPDETDFVESLQAIDRAIETAVDQYDLDHDRIGVLGFSQGAVLSLGLTIERPGVLDWTVALHGYLPNRYDESDLSSARDVPVFLTAGTQDEVIPETRARAAAEALQAASIDTTFRTYPTGHAVAADELQDVGEWVAARVDGSPQSS